MDEKRLVIALFGLAISAILGFLAYNFIAALTLSVFLCYSTRRYYRTLRRLRLPARARAGIVMASLAVPLLLLIGYSVLLLLIETRRFIGQYAVLEVAAENVDWIGEVTAIPELTVRGIYGAYRVGELDLIVDFLLDNLSILSSLSEIVLVLAHTFAETALPRLLGGTSEGDGLPKTQLRLDDS